MIRVALALAVTAAVTLFALPAVGTQHHIGISGDGTTWSSSLTTPLLDDKRRWVPGDVATVPVWIRNQSNDAASLGIGLSIDDRDSSLARDLIVTARTGGLTVTSVAGERSQVIDLGQLGAQEQVRVDLTVHLPSEADNLSQRRTTEIALVIALMQNHAGAGGGGAVAAPDEGPAGKRSTPRGQLASTGIGWLDHAAVLSALTTGTGVALIRSRKNAHQTKEAPHA